MHGRSHHNPDRRRAADLVTLDLMLTGVLGLAALTRMRSDPKLAFMQVAGLSIKATGADIQVGLDTCATVYLIKPARFSGLKAAVDQLLQSA